MRISCRQWLVIAFLGVACAAAQERTSPAQTGSRPLRILTGPYLQNATENAMTVMWITDRNATGAVEFGLPNAQLKTAFFRELAASGFQEFRTFDPRKRNFSFLVFNDTHDRPDTFPDMLKVAGDRPYDFALLNGDTLR